MKKHWFKTLFCIGKRISLRDKDKDKESWDPEAKEEENSKALQEDLDRPDGDTHGRHLHV